MIDINSISLRYGSQVLFDRVSAHVSTRDRIGLAGRNGAGKTTFLRMLLGREHPQSGEIVVGNGMSVGYLPQDGLEAHGRPLIEEVERAEGDIHDLQAALDAAHQRAANHTSDPDHDEAREAWDVIHHLENELQRREAHKLRVRAEKVLSGLGFQPDDFEKDTGTFSGGWQMRIALAKLLLQRPDYLLLDEPTNHLDLPSQRWLEKLLLQYPGGLVLISHDRAFLDLLTRKTFYLRGGQLEVYAGNYSFFESESAHREEIRRARKAAQDRKIEKTQQFIDRFRYKASKASQVQSRIKELEKVDRIELRQDEAGIDFSFPPAPRSGQVLVDIQNLHKSFGPLHLFRDFSLKLERGQRMAVVGVNGAGKSTLARVLAGEESLDAGHRLVGEKTRIAYFAQHQTDQLDPNHTALESVLQTTTAEEQQARSLLGAFLFTGDAVFKPVSVLSGGEKNRLALARILLQPANLLILDEPTNHLDIHSKETLLRALQDYDGALFIISHDRSFLDPLVDRTLEISPRGHRLFWTNVSGYLEKTETEATSANGSGPADKSFSPKERRRLKAERIKALTPLRQKVRRCEEAVAALDREIADWEEKMKDPDFFSGRPGQKDDLQAYDSAKRKQARALEDWENAQQALEQAEAKTQRSSPSLRQ